MNTLLLKSFAILTVMMTAGSALTPGAPAAHAIGAHSAASIAGAPATPAATSASASSDSRISVTLNGEAWTIVRREGDLSISIDGEAAPADRIQRRGSQYRLLGRDGETVAQLMVGPSGNLRFQSVSGEAREDRGARPPQPRGDDRPERREQRERSQPGSIGITLSRVPEIAAEQLGVDPEAVVLIGRVRPDGPAKNAGLQLFDVITAVDGRAPVTREMIRDHVRRKHAGDTVTLTILRRGESQEIDVTLAPVEHEIVDRRPGARRWIIGEWDELRSLVRELIEQMEAGNDLPEAFLARLQDAEERIRDWWEDAYERGRPWMILSDDRRRELRDLLAEVEGDLLRSADDWPDEAQIAQWFETFRERREEFSERMRELSKRFELSAPEIEIQRDEDGRRVIMRGPGTLRPAPIERRLERLESQLDSLEQRLMRIEESLKQLSADR